MNRTPAFRLRRWLASTALLGVACGGVMAAAAAEDGTQNVLLQANEVVYDTREGVVTAQGGVEITSGDRILMSDRVSYNQKTGVVSASGHVSLLQANGDVAFANHAEITDDMRDGVLSGFAALIGENGRLAAASARRSEGRFTEGHRAVFTPCKICREKGERTPLWQIKAYRVVHDNELKRITFEDAVLEFWGVPVLYLPFLSQPDPTVRHKSGFLTPDLGSSTDIGSFIEIPYYVSLSPSRDLTIAPLLTTEGGQVLKAEYRERWDRGGFWLQASGAYDKDQGGPSQSAWFSHVFGSGRVPITDVWRTGFDVALTSDDTYLERYDISNEDRLVTDLFLEGIKGRSLFSVSGYYFQGLRATDDPGVIPYALPLVEYAFVPEYKIIGGQFRADASALALFRNEGADVGRASLSMQWRLPFVTANGQLITFETQLRGDIYHTRDVNPLGLPGLPDDSETITRGLALASAEWSWPFVYARPGSPAALVVEPVIQFIASPYGGNPDGIPNEDSAGFEFDETNLFSFNKFPGLDLWETGHRANAGLRVSAVFPTGFVEAMIGQNYRLEPDRTFAPESGLGSNQSDIIGRFTVQFPPYIDLTHRFRLDETDGSVRRNEIYMTGKYGRSSIKLSYLRLTRENLGLGLRAREEANMEASVPIYGYWSVFGAARRDLEADQMLDSRFGLTYEDECFLISLGFRRKFTRDRDIDPSSSVLLRIGLKTGPGGN